MELTRHLQKFIKENFLYGNENRSLTSKDSLIQNGIIDSTGILELISFLEDTFQIQVEDEDLIPENFDSINKIKNYLQKKLIKNKIQILV